MLHKKYSHTLVLGSLMGVVLSLCMSGVMTWLNLGFGADFVWQWGQGFIVSFIISTPLSIIILPTLQRITNYICGPRDTKN